MFYLVFLFCFIFAHKIDAIQIELVQPNGDIINCFVSGDQYYRSVHDQDGYSIIQNERDGYYYYAIKNNDEIVPSSFKVGDISPSESNIPPNIIISKEQYLNKRNLYWNNIERRDAPSLGTINNINIFIRFDDQTEFPNSRNFYDLPFNKEDGPSMGHYFNEVSYDLLTLNTYHYPATDDMSYNVSYQDQYPRDYYKPYNEVTNPIGYQNDNQSRSREHTLLKNAINSIASQVPSNLDVDSNNDGYVDNVTFLVRGMPGAWSDLLWPHRWVLYSENAYINGARVYDYNLNMEQGGYFNVGTLCHEFFHSLGAPDLYHFWDEVAPVAVGGWDVMDQSSDTPQSMTAYMKYRYTDWINELPILNNGGTYELSPLSEPNNNILRINSPSSNTEYFVVEYRKREGIYEVNTPGGEDGMIIYRVNTQYSGNANGPPDELYVYRTGGTLTSNGTFSGAVFNAESGRNKFNDNTNPSCFLSNNSPGGININNISEAGNVIRFDLVNMILLPELIGISSDSDSDGVANPGEQVIIDLSVNNLTNINAEDVIVTVNTNNQGVTINNPEFLFDSIQANQSNDFSLLLNIDENTMGTVSFSVNINSNYTENNQQLIYIDNFEFNLEIEMNQKGFPYDTTNEIHTSPIIGDLNSDGYNEIIFGDHFGEIRAIGQNGNEILFNIFPFLTNDQIWGSPILEDIDLDGNLDVIFVSKDGSVYVLDKFGLKWSYETESRLIGTPSVLNVDDSNELEIIVAGYSSNQDNFYIFSANGSLIDQIEISEKIKSGFAIADLDENGYDDIVFGTDDDNLYLIYDGNQIAPGFPFQGIDKFIYKPLILKLPEELTSDNYRIVVSSKNVVYQIDRYGDIVFEVEFSEDISTSPSVLNHQGFSKIFVGLKNGDIFWLDFNGNPYFFENINSEVIGEIVFSDLNSDFNPEIIVVNDLGEMHVLGIDGEYFQNFPLEFNFPFSSSPLVYDLDSDQDLEIIAGTTNAIVAVDVKSIGSTENYWNIFSNGFKRTSFSDFAFSYCVTGDVNQDYVINVLDVVSLVNIIFYNDSITYDILCTSDMNNDNLINVQDIILLVDRIFDFAN